MLSKKKNLEQKFGEFFCGVTIIKKNMDFKFMDLEPSSFYSFGRWNLSKNRGFNICSGPSDYYAQWFTEGDKWRLYISSYSDDAFAREKKLLHTVDSLFEVFEYMRHNTHPVE